MIKTGTRKEINNLIILAVKNKGLSITERKNCAQYIMKNHLIGQDKAGDNIYNLNFIEVTVQNWIEQNLRQKQRRNQNGRCKT